MSRGSAHATAHYVQGSSLSDLGSQPVAAPALAAPALAAPALAAPALAAHAHALLALLLPAPGQPGRDCTLGT